jgi:Mrp family chromosome partitioning ATPase
MINPAKTVEEAHTMIVPVAPGGSRQPDKSESGLPFESYIMQTGISNLFMVPAGKPSTSPANLLSMPEMKQFLDWAERRGDYIVIDCPALTYAEAHVLGSLSDQTFLVIDATRDRIKQVESIREELLNTGVKLSGFIANKLGRWI